MVGEESKKTEKTKEEFPQSSYCFVSCSRRYSFRLKLKKGELRLYMSVKMYVCVCVGRLVACLHEKQSRAEQRDADRETAKEHERSGLEDELGQGVEGLDNRDEMSSSLYLTVCCLSSLQGVTGTQ